MSTRGSHIRPVSGNHHLETMLPAPLESRSRNTTTVNAYDRMTQEQDEALDESNLHQNVSQPDRDEVEQAHRPRLLAAGPLRQGEDQKRQHGEQRDGQDHSQNGHAEIIFPVDALPQRFGMQDLSQLQSEEEERSIVGHRRHIVGIARRKVFRVVGLDQLGKGTGAGGIMVAGGLTAPSPATVKPGSGGA